MQERFPRRSAGMTGSVRGAGMTHTAPVIAALDAAIPANRLSGRSPIMTEEERGNDKRRANFVIAVLDAAIS